MPLFAIASLLPAVLIACAAIWGGLWSGVALFGVTALVAGLDRLTTWVAPAQDDREFPVADGLSVVLALTHFALLAVCVTALGAQSLGPLEKLALVLSAGLYMGQVGNSNAHELIHKGSRFMHDLGMWVYISLLFGHHTSAHVLIHHRNVATAADPNTARLNEGYYRYAVRAWTGSFRAGYHAEVARLNRVGRSRWHHPYVIYVGGAVVMIAIAAGLGGWTGLWGYLTIAAFAQSQLLLSDYVQHYGLVRHMQDNGKPEPVGARHSWNAPQWYSSAMMLNAPRHSDHHAHPARSFPALTIPDGAPQLPRSLPVMATLALFPRLWRRIMNPRVARYQ